MVYGYKWLVYDSVSEILRIPYSNLYQNQIVQPNWQRTGVLMSYILYNETQN
uniref:Uncharacterized protein n=1 Tax=Anguilla anguilla TaxID=7936 RepID=A0A0E9PLG0_ANGAN